MWDFRRQSDSLSSHGKNQYTSFHTIDLASLETGNTCDFLNYIPFHYGVSQLHYLVLDTLSDQSLLCIRTSSRTCTTFYSHSGYIHPRIYGSKTYKIIEMLCFKEHWDSGVGIIFLCLLHNYRTEL